MQRNNQSNMHNGEAHDEDICKTSETHESLRLKDGNIGSPDETLQQEHVDMLPKEIPSSAGEQRKEQSKGRKKQRERKRSPRDNAESDLQDISQKVTDQVHVSKKSEEKIPTMVECSFRFSGDARHTVRGVTAMLERFIRNTLNLQVNSVRSEPRNHLVETILTFISKAQARKFLKQIRASADFLKIKGRARILEVESADDKIVTFSKKLLEIGEMAIKKHEQKIISCTENLEQIKVQGKDYIEKATRAKLNELKAQKSEFQTKLDELQRTLSQAKGKINETFQDCKKQLARETKKLDQALPMYAYRNLVLQQIRFNPVIVLLGETGSGKSTQIPIYLLEEGYGDDKRIVCTQPRKVAALSLARHVSKELDYPIGKEIGYKLGREDRRSQKTKLLYMTDHTLLNECIKDPSLSAYSVVIIDEAHERSIYTDLLLGMLQKCLQQRPELRVMITSATIDPDVFVQYFGGSEECPVVKVPGRLFPVDITYNKENRGPDQNHVKEAVDKVVELHRKEPNGDILVFLATPAETEQACNLLLGHQVPKLKVMQLHGRLQPAEQQAVFDPVAKDERKVVFSTNVAETSVTIPGIKVVVDAGLAKEKKYDAKRNMGVLELNVITQSSANQRKGRAGRTGPGKCFRLYTEAEYNAMEKISKPEIFRVHLGQALLKLMELGISNPLQFKFVESPSVDALNAAMKVLCEIGAVENGCLTDLGHKVAKLSVEPILGKTILSGIEANIGLEIIVIAAFAGTGSSVFYRGGTPEANAVSDQQKLRFCSEFGDMVTALNVFKEWQSVEEKEKGKWCMQNSINGKMMKILRDQTHELRHELKKELGLNLDPNFNEDQSVLNQHVPEIMLGCYPSNLSRFTGHSNAGYIIPSSDMCVHPHPGSALNALKIQPKWLLFGQLLKTSRDFAINLTPITDDQVEKIKSMGQLQIDEDSLQEKVLEPLKIPNLSDHILRILAGPRHQTRKNLQERISMECGGAIVEIDLDFRNSASTTYANLKYHPYIESILGDQIYQIKQELRRFRTKYAISTDRNNSTSAMIECGGAVLEIMMPNEFNAFKFDCESESKGEEILEQLTELGDVYSKNIKRLPRSRFETNIEFKTADEASKATEFLKEKHQISVYTGRKDSNNQNLPDFQVKLTWQRRPILGHGVIRCHSPEDARRVHSRLPGSLYGRMGHRQVEIKGQIYKVLCPKPAMSDIRIVEVERDVNPERFKRRWMETIRSSCPDIAIKDVYVPRSKGFETTPANLTDYERKVVAKLNTITQGFHIDIPKPKNGSFELQCWVTLQSADDRENVMDRMIYLELDERFKGDIQRNVVGSVYVAADMMKVVDADLSELLEIENLNNSQNAYSRQMKNGNWRINIICNSIAGLIEYKRRIEHVIAPTRIDCSQCGEVQLLQPDGKAMLQQVEKETDTKIICDFRNKAVVIYGTLSNRERAHLLIDDHVKYLAGTIHETIHLSGSDKPIGLMKALLRKYGTGLEELKVDLKLHSLNLNLRRHVIVLRGSEESISELKGILDATSQELGAKEASDTEREDCNVCLCPADEDSYRLMLCGHLYCKSCIEDLLKDAVANGNIPISCCSQMCGELIVLKDIQKLLNNKMADLVKVSVNCYIMNNKDKVITCPTPDCPTVYKRTLQACLFICPACQVELCTKCGLLSHIGLTCEQNKITLKDGGGVEKWLDEDKMNRGRCPSCQAPIEKTYGCDHITCSECKKHVCWKCKTRFFNSPGECYDHLAREHDGIF